MTVRSGSNSALDEDAGMRGKRQKLHCQYDAIVSYLALSASLPSSNYLLELPSVNLLFSYNNIGRVTQLF
uniref:Uncharacterized protein n=1 Tax=Pararge aegeria TaxID=116150 RepID=S4PRU3_9NEOP